MIKNAQQKLKAQARSEINQRLCWPLYSVLSTILALFAVNPSEFNRKSRSKRIIKYTICSTIVILGYFIGNNFSTKYFVFSFIPLINLVFWLIVFSYILFYKRSNFSSL